MYCGAHGRTIIFAQTKNEVNDLALNSILKQVYINHTTTLFEIEKMVSEEKKLKKFISHIPHLHGHSVKIDH